MDDQWRDIDRRVTEMEKANVGLQRAIAENSAMTYDIKQNTDDIVEFFKAGQGTFKALKMIGTIAKWITTVAAAVAVTFLMWKGGNKP